MNSENTNLSPIAVANDPRFRLARELLCSSDDDGPESAINIFATLLESCINTMGENCLDTALCQYEYGNSLFRAVVRKENLNDTVDHNQNDEGDKKPTANPSNQREIMASAAEKRSRENALDGSTQLDKKRLKVETSAREKAVIKQQIVDNSGMIDSDNTLTKDAENSNDVVLALEMMEASFSIIYDHASTDNSKDRKESSEHLKLWALGQLPRILICIGDIHSHLRQYGNAVDAYCRALPYREDEWKRMSNGNPSKEKVSGIEQLKCQRHLIEAYALVTEALLACPPWEDVICQNDEPVILVKAKERLDFTRSYFELARDGLEDILCRVGKMAAEKIDISSEKQDICYLVQMVAGVGTSLAEVEQDHLNQP